MVEQEVEDVAFLTAINHYSKYTHNINRVYRRDYTTYTCIILA